MSAESLPSIHPVGIKVHRKSRRLEMGFNDGTSFQYSFEFLRVFSPSAETRGHGNSDGKLEHGKRDVDVSEVEQVGNYALRPRFSDGHESGIYSWRYLHDLGSRQQELWDMYLAELKDAGLGREP